MLLYRVVSNWWRRDGHSLVLEDLEEVLDELPERLIVGMGAQSFATVKGAASDLGRGGYWQTCEC